MRVFKVTDYTEFPGPNLIKNGNYSGEYFYNLIKPIFKQCVERGIKFFIDLDGTAGYAASWERQVFTSLRLDFGTQTVMKHLIIKSNQEPYLVPDIFKSYILSEESMPDGISDYQTNLKIG